MASRKQQPVPAKKLIIRIQSRDGTKRVELNADSTLQNLIAQVKSEFGLPQNAWTLYRDKTRRDPIKPSVSRLATANIKHGELLYLDYSEGAKSTAAGPSTTSKESGVVVGNTTTAVEPNRGDRVVEDDVDVLLEKQDGLIKRERDPSMCHHGPTAKCSFCLPIDPFDEEYLKKRDLKHMSFHAFIRKLLGGVHGRSTAMKYPLENIICHIKPGCKTHAPWPEGICTKCQPNAVTLNRQRYRHVDNIVFENQSLVNRFLDYWRKSGHQRIGILLGRYEPHPDVPLGIKCVVTAIYEPPQTSTSKSVRLSFPLSPIADTPDSIRNRSDEEKEYHQMEQLTRELGLRVVGWIFTDLTADPKEPGAVVYNRHADTHFLSAEECITAACFQCKYPNPCKFAEEGYFGSKFVSVIVCGGEDKQVHFQGYQVSNQCAALIRDRCLVPTKDAPELAWARESTAQQYVPDVSFMEKDVYGNEVSKLARPLPVEYLIIDVPCGVPLEQQYTFSSGENTQPFAVENRAVLGAFQNFDTVCFYASQFTKEQFLEMISDFHLLLYLITNTTFPFSIDNLKPVFEAIISKDQANALEWSNTNEHWTQFVHLMTAHATGGSSSSASSAGYIAPAPTGRSVDGTGGIGVDGGGASAGAGGGGQGAFACVHCTYLNPVNHGDCVLCGLPVNS